MPPPVEVGASQVGRIGRLLGAVPGADSGKCRHDRHQRFAVDDALGVGDKGLPVIRMPSLRSPVESSHIQSLQRLHLVVWGFGRPEAPPQVGELCRQLGRKHRLVSVVLRPIVAEKDDEGRADHGT